MLVKHELLNMPACWLAGNLITSQTESGLEHTLDNMDFNTEFLEFKFHQNLHISTCLCICKMHSARRSIYIGLDWVVSHSAYLLSSIKRIVVLINNKAFRMYGTLVHHQFRYGCQTVFSKQRKGVTNWVRWHLPVGAPKIVIQSDVISIDRFRIPLPYHCELFLQRCHNEPSLGPRWVYARNVDELLDQFLPSLACLLGT